jgi:hypothetical protein
VDTTGGVDDPVDVVPECAVEAVAVAVIKLLEDVLDVEPEVLPDAPVELELEDDELAADDSATVLDELEEEVAVPGEALVRT